eukprot:jgi/Mesen1/9968/ME000072S09381
MNCWGEIGFSAVRNSYANVQGYELKVLLALVVIASSVAILLNRSDPLRELPGPPSFWLLGNLLDIGRKGYHICQLQWLQKYGTVYKYYMGRSPVVIVCEPDLIRDICVRQFKSFHDRPLPPFLANESLRGLIFSRGDYWAGVRSSILPLFHSAKLRLFADVMHASLDVLVGRLRGVTPGRQVDVLEWLEEMTTDVMGAASFGIDLGMQDGGGKAELGRAYAANERSSSQIRLSTVLTLLFPRLRLRAFLQATLGAIPFTPEYAIRRRLRFILQECNAIIEQRRNEPGGDDSKIDLLTLLTRAKGKNTSQAITSADIRALVFSLLGAGSATTANTIAFAIYLLAQNPEAEARLVAEIDQFFEKQDSESEALLEPSSVDQSKGEQGGQVAVEQRPTYDELSSFPYTEQVVQETLRMFPTGALIAREALEDTSLGPHFIPRGTEVIIPVYAVHRHCQFYPAPNEFRPGRFDPDEEEAKKRHPSVYLPFGLGPRMCLGYKFALEEVKLALIALYRNFTFRIPPRFEELKISAGLNLKPRAVMVSVHPRSTT